MYKENIQGEKQTSFTDTFLCPQQLLKITIVTYLTPTGHMLTKLLRQDTSIYSTQATH